MTVLTSRRAAVAAAAAVVVAVLPAASARAAGPSSAPSPSGSAARTAACVAHVQVQSAGQVARRMTTLSDLTSQVNAAVGLTDAHRQLLLGTISSDTTGLTSLGATIAGRPAGTTCATAVSDAHQIASSFRVYLLLVPQAHITMAADRGLTAASALSGVEATLASAIDAEAAAGKDVTALREQDAILVAQAKVATTDFTGLGDAALAVTPASFNADPSTFATMVTTGRAGIAALRAASSAGRQLAAGLRALA